ncbi:hydroxyacid dehydrogenase [Dongia sedimenti]|uniref:Hydroxyacid dehydrogenase n=1 Tax=Dongia sedimenti TaxID=3064282 RepID=A0ABU0YFT6_9PROT|nr:hydroxyacid dehydrogenase [Rhodospirillaceae bacterium R-7]
MPDRPLILIDPLPRTLDVICEPDVRKRLEALGRLVISEGKPMADAEVDRLLPEAEILIGQTAMPKARLDRAPKLRAIFNVETNFLPNIDYREAQARGIWVLSPTSSFAAAVAESSLAMAIDLARGITAADRAMRSGTELYGLAANEGSFMFAGASVGIVGFGDLGRQLRALLVPFRNPVKVYDPWLPADVIRAADAEPASLDEVLATSRVIFVFASVTTENQGFIGQREFGLMQPGACFLLMSRAAVVDFPAFLDAVRSGRIRAATDVFPIEPVAKDDPVRKVENLLLSAHRTGGMKAALHQIGRMTVADAELILKGLPPVMCRRADPAIAARLRSMPVAST